MIKSKKTYNSDSRKAQAQKTRERILNSAKNLLELKGFDNMTIEQIAQDAQVSAPTIYALFKSKSGVLIALIDSSFSKESFESIVQKWKLEKSPAKRLEITANLARQIYDAEKNTLNLFQNTSILNLELKKLEIQREKRRFDRQEETFNMLVKDKALAEDLSLSQARDILWMFTGRDLYRMLVIERSWSSDEYEKWLAQLLIRTLLKSEAK